VTFLLTGKRGKIALDSFADLSCGPVELHRTASKPVVSLTMSLDQFPPALVEHAFDAFLENSAEVLEQYASRPAGVPPEPMS
jgi:hypothetical protein